MPRYDAPVRDMKFILHDVLSLQSYFTILRGRATHWNAWDILLAKCQKTNGASPANGSDCTDSKRRKGVPLGWWWPWGLKRHFGGSCPSE